MDALKICTNEFMRNNDLFESFQYCKQFYKLLSSTNLTEDKIIIFNNVIVPKLFQLLNEKKIRRDFVYLSLLSNNGPDVIKKLALFDYCTSNLDIFNATELFDFCMFSKKHWLLEIIQENYVSGFSSNISSAIKFLKLINESNQENIKFDILKDCLRQTSFFNNQFQESYFAFLNNIIGVIGLCQSLTICEKPFQASDVYYYLIQNSALKTILKFAKFDSFETCNNILDNLTKYGVQSDIEHFTAYFILYNILHCLQLCKDTNKKETEDISKIIKLTQPYLINLSNLKFQIEILQCILSFLFLQENHFFTTSIHASSTFYCTENEIRLLLIFLKSSCQEIKNKNVYNKSMEYGTLLQIEKYLMDAIWRLELITSSKQHNSTRKKIQSDTISYLLAAPESLIHLCMKQNNFDKGNQVIKIFNLENSETAINVNNTIKLQEYKEELKKLFIVQKIKSEIPELTFDEKSIKKSVEEFFRPTSSDDTEDSCYRKTTKEENERLIFENVVDLTITQPNNFFECYELLKIAESFKSKKNAANSNYLMFYSKLLPILEVINQHDSSVSIKSILCNSNIDIILGQYNKTKEFYLNLATLCDTLDEQLLINEKGKLNTKHVAHKTFQKIQALCTNYTYEVKDREQINYLLRFFKYLKVYSKIVYVEKNNSNLISKGKEASFFEILKMSRIVILKNLVCDKKIDVCDFEHLYSTLKLDLIYEVSSTFFPKIPLYFDEMDINKCFIKSKKMEKPDKNIILYIQKRNWLLAFILSEIFNMNELNININESRIQTFINLVQLERVQTLKTLFMNNNVVTALQHKINEEAIENYAQNILKENNMTLDKTDGNVEMAEEIFEHSLDFKNLRQHIIDIIHNIPESQFKNSKKLSDLYDIILSNTSFESNTADYVKYIRFISDHSIRISCIVDFCKWSPKICMDVMKSEFSRFSKISEDQLKPLKRKYNEIELYENIKNVSEDKYCLKLSEVGAEKDIQILLKTLEVDLLIKYIELFVTSCVVINNIESSYFLKLFDTNTEYSKIDRLLNIVCPRHAKNICYLIIDKLKTLEDLNFIIDFLLKFHFDTSPCKMGHKLVWKGCTCICDGDENLDEAKRLKISLRTLSCFSATEREQYWPLRRNALDIIEMLIMNTRLEKLGEILEKIKPDLENCEFDENEISIESIDDLLRKYAEKSLEFRIALQSGTKSVKTSDSSVLLQSLDSMNFVGRKETFIIPERVPSKSEWVQNYEVTECMCCMETIFSMFNRRHHCRRCGRVVCENCSQKRMLVPTYEDIPVRVCTDCHEFMIQYGSSATCSRSDSLTKSLENDYWVLTNDSNHNQIVREEFSYEYAPSISLCLAILKHHSKTEDYPRFLISQCENMLRLLHPINAEAVQEIDYPLVIKMLKSLAIAAKMLSSDCMVQWASTLGDRILSQVDLFNLLAERGCLHLIPSTNPNQNRYIDAATLRRLRDKLLEREQWNLALEVSTKAGLDNSGVFAAWGKSYLKAGCLQFAREKFQRYFDKTAFYDTSTELSSSFSSKSLSHYQVKTLNSPEKRPTKDPPLLIEIIHILESNTTVLDSSIVKEMVHLKPLTGSSWSLNSSGTNFSQQPDTAICIMNRLKKINNIICGNYGFVSDITESSSEMFEKPHLEKIFYDECVYYFTKYGSHMGLLEFYIKHGYFQRCLQYMLDNKLDSELFVEIYMMCLKKSQIIPLHDSMIQIDSTLNVFKDYLQNICRHLEKQCKLNSLYQLQLFISDFVRAAMTCIKFYKDEAVNYLELLGRVDYLHKAQQHLQQKLELEQWLEVATVPTSNNELSTNFEAKSIANPSLVMNMDLKLVNKHISTIKLQIQIVQFLSECESSGTEVLEILPDVLPFINEDLSEEDIRRVKIPTLFSSYYERVQLAILTIICGKNVEDGFNIAFRIIHDYKLNPIKVYCHAGKELAKAAKYTNIAQLVNCIRTNEENDPEVTTMCDEMLILAIQTLTKEVSAGPELDGLIKLVTNKLAKISAYIETKQLKSAYLLAAKYKKISDIRRIQREAELLNQQNIKLLCDKFLKAHFQSPSDSTD